MSLMSTIVHHLTKKINDQINSLAIIFSFTLQLTTNHCDPMILFFHTIKLAWYLNNGLFLLYACDKILYIDLLLLVLFLWW